eukprot:5748917-Pyramimonas_sp.AAC.1
MAPEARLAFTDLGVGATNSLTWPGDLYSYYQWAYSRGALPLTHPRLPLRLPPRLPPQLPPRSPPQLPPRSHPARSESATVVPRLVLPSPLCHTLSPD